MRPDPRDPRYYAFDAPPHCKPFALVEQHIKAYAPVLREMFNRDGMAATMHDLGQMAWVMEESAREIRRLQIKCGELIEPVPSLTPPRT